MRQKLMYVLRFIYHKINNRKKVSFGITSVPSFDSIFEGMSKLHPYVKFHGFLGYGSYIGNHSCLSAKVGRFTSIAPYVRCNDGIHPYKKPFVSTAPCFYSLNPGHSQNGSTFANEQLFEESNYSIPSNKIAITIGNDCWIGEGAFIIGGVTIADGAMVLAHAVVTKNVPPYAIVGGVPAKIIGYRYDEETINYLLRIRWWSNNPHWFKENWKLLSNIDKLVEFYKEKEIDDNNF